MRHLLKYFDCDFKGRYTLMIDFSSYNWETESIIKSKVNQSTIDEFRKDMDLFVGRLKKYAKICFMSWLQEEESHGDYSYPKTTDDGEPIYGGVWIYIDFMTHECYSKYK